MSTATQTEQILPTGTWAIDPVHSQIAFAVDYMVGTFRGSVSPVDARLEVDENGQAVLTGSAPVSGIKVEDERLSGHLLSPDFFDAERTPEVRFVSKEIRRDGDEIEIDGELTIKDVTHPVQAKGRVGDAAEHPAGDIRLGLQLETTIDRTEYGLDWNMPLPSGEPALGNEVTLSADLYLIKE
jgi:polyisoprenoid-binding protein YceI